MAVRSLSLLAACVLAPLAAGCGETIHVYDDLDLELDLDLTPPRVDEDLHTPYVLGADVDIFVSYSDEDARIGDWRATVEDESIFDVIASDNPGDGPHIQGKAVGEGVTYLVLRDGDGDVLTRQRIEVRTPDEARLYAHGWMIVGREDQSRVDEARVLAGGTATYLVRWFKDGQELYGNGALDVVVPDTDTVVATPRTSFLFENREWITFTAPETPGLHTLTLRALGTPVAPIDVGVVPPTDVARVEIHGQNERGAHEGDRFVAMAQAYDAQDRRVFGVAYDWQVNGVEQLGEGDLYRYAYAPGALDLLTAKSGDLEASAMLHVGEGYVDSSNNIGCTVAPGRAPRPLGLASLALLAGLLVVHRRGRS